MGDKRYVPQHIILACDKGAAPSELISFSNVETTIIGENMCTMADKIVNVNFQTFGACAAKNGNPCMPAVTDWTNLSDLITIGPNELLMEDSELPCTAGGTIKIFYSMQAAGTYMPEEEEEEGGFWGTAWSFTKGVGKGLWAGAKGTVVLAADIVVWSAKHSPAYMMYDWEGYQDQIAQDVETAKAIGNAAVDAGTWAYRSSVINQILDPVDWAEQQASNKEMVDAIAEHMGNMDAEDWGNVTGQLGFEVLIGVATAGSSTAVTTLRAADKGMDAVRVIETMDDIADAARALENADDVMDAGRALETIEDGTHLPPVPDELGDVVRNSDPPGTFRDSNGKLRNDDGTFATDPNAPAPIDGNIPYANHRPSYRAGQVDEVWENAKSPDGNVYDPNTGELIEWDTTKPRNGQWDMGHIEGHRYENVHRQYMDGDITRQEFLDWYQNPDNYAPELPSNNRSNNFN